MAAVSLKTRLRGQLNRLLLNPLLTYSYDLLAPSVSFGDRGERCAERHLLRHGLQIIERSFKNAIGEIDLVAVEDRTIVFVEVKTRRSDNAGTPAEAVDELKQQKITKTATSFLKLHNLLDCRCRFDVISITWPQGQGSPEIEHFRDAFEAA